MTGFLLAIMSTSLLIHSFTITYFVCALKYEKKSQNLRKAQPNFNLNFIIRIGSIVFIIGLMLSIPADFLYGLIGFLANVVRLIIYNWIYSPWGYSEFLILSLFFLDIFLISCIIILVPRRKYEILNNI